MRTLELVCHRPATKWERSPPSPSPNSSPESDIDSDFSDDDDDTDADDISDIGEEAGKSQTEENPFFNGSDSDGSDISDDSEDEEDKETVAASLSPSEIQTRQQQSAAVLSVLPAFLLETSRHALSAPALCCACLLQTR